jgi:hypothetical protein
MSLPEIKAPLSDSRKAARTTVRRIGWLTRARGEQIRECMVWDESDTGMRLIVDAPNEIPDTFYVYPTLRCRVIWRAEKQIGVEFLP